ncbi:pyridoxal phosphate-dependent aminotransferase [Mesorhizobium sp. CAU 1732]|uniref:pyridoxal phosphate-dependent aminotransferase n=1 Tax=Mesorhizobium sp. CAU 1732 TaxID=3140358 RepID=UPI0032619412
MIRASRRVTETAVKSFGMYEKAALRHAAGHDVIRLELGRPYADTPHHIKQATIDALLAGEVHYSDMQGLPVLRAALADKVRKANDVSVDASEILVTNGLTHASFAAFLAFLDPGDEVILLEPFYPQHVGKIELAGAKVVTAPLDSENGFSISADLIRPRITARTKMIVLVNPVNPTGRVYGRDELQALADLAIEHDLLVVSDEVYEEIVYDGHRHVSIASLPGMKERTISMFAFTKSFSMDGWRLGYIAADASLLPALTKITMNDVTHVNTFIQYGALAAVTGPGTVLRDLVAADRRKRDLVVQRLNQMPGVTCALPEGTIYAFADVRATGLPSVELAARILETANVSVEAGSFYGPGGEGYLRVCFGSQSEARLDEAMDRLQGFFNRI